MTSAVLCTPSCVSKGESALFLNDLFLCGQQTAWFAARVLLSALFACRPALHMSTGSSQMV